MGEDDEDSEAWELDCEGSARGVGLEEGDEDGLKLFKCIMTWFQIFFPIPFPLKSSRTTNIPMFPWEEDNRIPAQLPRISPIREKRKKEKKEKKKKERKRKEEQRKKEKEKKKRKREKEREREEKSEISFSFE